MVYDVFFVAPSGEIIEDENISSHVGLAEKIFEKNPNLRNSYDAFSRWSNKNSSTAFLIQSGYLCAGGTGESGHVLYNSKYITPILKRKLLELYEQGFTLHDCYAQEIRENDDWGNRF